MFDFFEGLIEKLGVKLISDFSNKLIEFIKDVKSKSNGENNGNGGNYAQIGSSGYSAKIGSSGYSAQIGSSGNSAKIGSSGNSAQIGSSGNYAQIGSSGNSAKIGSSGNSAKIDISGTNSIAFANGWKSLIKAKKGTWISLAEYGRNEENIIIPIYALSAQIGNSEYRDYKNRILKENEYYCLHNKKFHPVDFSDGYKVIENSRKVRDRITIIKGIDMDDLLEDEVREIFVAKEGELSAHGYSLREAIDDLTFKKMENVEIKEIVAEIKKTNKVTRSQYRAITGACSYGTNKFCEEHQIQNLEEIEINELRKILVNDYGAERFWNLIDNKGE